MSAERLKIADLARASFIHLRQRTPFARNRGDTWVLLFPEHKIAYIPIPKAASSSIRAELLRLIDIDPANFSKEQRVDGLERRRFTECAHLLSGDWLVFTVVRNPQTRASSAYLNKIVHRKPVFPALRRMGLRKGDSFVRFLRVLAAWPVEVLDKHVAPQSELLSAPLTAFPQMRVLKLETLESDWAQLAAEITERTGKSLQVLGRRNQSRATGVHVYDASSRKLVKKLYAKDFDTFGYRMQEELDERT